MEIRSSLKGLECSSGLLTTATDVQWEAWQKGKNGLVVCEQPVMTKQRFSINIFHPLTSSKSFTMLQPRGFFFTRFHSLFPSCRNSPREHLPNQFLLGSSICAPHSWMISPLVLWELNLMQLFCFYHICSFSSHWSSCKNQQPTQEPMSVIL